MIERLGHSPIRDELKYRGCQRDVNGGSDDEAQGSVYEAPLLARREKTTVCLSGSKPTLR